MDGFFLLFKSVKSAINCDCIPVVSLDKQFCSGILLVETNIIKVFDEY